MCFSYLFYRVMMKCLILKLVSGFKSFAICVLNDNTKVIHKDLGNICITASHTDINMT